MKEFLPIGSVVLVKEGTKKLMICGRFQKKIDDNVIFDYSACYYPEGIINPRNLYLFNNDDIDRVFYMGMQDAEEFQFRNRLTEEYNRVMNEEKTDD